MATKTTLGDGRNIETAYEQSNSATQGKTRAVTLVDVEAEPVGTLASPLVVSGSTTSTPAASEAHIGQVGGATVKVSSTITRPADTSAYAAGDVIADSTTAPTVGTLAGCARINGGSGAVLNAMLIDSANIATPGTFEAWVFDTTFTPDNDNAVFTPSDSECLTVVAVIPFSTSYVGDATSGAGGNRIYQGDPVNRGFVCGAGVKTLFWALVVRTGFTPVASETFTLRCTFLQD